MCKNVLPAYSSATIIFLIKQVFPELRPRFFMKHSVDEAALYTGIRRHTEPHYAHLIKIMLMVKQLIHIQSIDYLIRCKNFEYQQYQYSIVRRTGIVACARTAKTGKYFYIRQREAPHTIVVWTDSTPVG